MLDKITDKCKRTYKKMYKADKLYSLKSIVNFLLVLVVTNYTERLKALKRRYEIIFSTYYNTAYGVED